jgi:hypothetical protein
MPATRPPAALAALLLLAALAPSGAAAATKVKLVNPGMDSTIPLAPGQCIEVGRKCDFQGDGPVGWTVNGADTGGLNPDEAMYATPWIGGEVAFIGGTMDGTGWLQQEVGTMMAGVTYTLRLNAGCRLDKPCAGYQVVLLFDDEVAHTFTGKPSAQVPGVFQTLSWSFDAAAGRKLTIRLGAPKKGGIRSEVDYDNVRLSYEAAAQGL